MFRIMLFIYKLNQYLCMTNIKYSIFIGKGILNVGILHISSVYLVGPISLVSHPNNPGDIKIQDFFDFKMC